MRNPDLDQFDAASDSDGAQPSRKLEITELSAERDPLESFAAEPAQTAPPAPPRMRFEWVPVEPNRPGRLELVRPAPDPVPRRARVRLVAEVAAATVIAIATFAVVRAVITRPAEETTLTRVLEEDAVAPAPVLPDFRPAAPVDTAALADVDASLPPLTDTQEPEPPRSLTPPRIADTSRAMPPAPVRERPRDTPAPPAASRPASPASSAASRPAPVTSSSSRPVAETAATAGVTPPVERRVENPGSAVPPAVNALGTTVAGGPASTPAAPASSSQSPAPNAQLVASNSPVPAPNTQLPTPTIQAPASRAAVVPPAAPPAASPVVAAAARVTSPKAAVESVLGRYAEAFTSLDAQRAKAVWPSVNQRNLQKAFENLEEQEFNLGSCDIMVLPPRALAQCNGTARYTPRVGDRRERTQARRWTFRLTQSGQDWSIESVESQ